MVEAEKDKRCTLRGKEGGFILKSKYGFASICTMLLLMAAMIGGGGCGGSSDSLPASPDDIQPGAQYEGTLILQENGEDTVLMRVAYEARNIETDSSLSPAVALFVTKEEYLDETSGTLKTMEDLSGPTPEEVETFLTNSWDASYEGTEDKGVNAEEFLDFLEEHNMPMDQFFRFLEALNYSMVEFLEVIQVYSTQLDSLDGEDVFNEIESFCDLAGIELGSFFTDIKQVFGTHAAFCTKLVNLDTGMHNLYNNYISWYMTQETELEDSFAEFLAYLKDSSSLQVCGDTPKIDPVKLGKLGLDVLKFGWDVIKDGKAQVQTDGAFTSVLRKGTTALDYGNAKRNETSILHYKVNDTWIKSWILIETKFRGSASYAATTPEFGGQYLQNVQFDVESAYAQWGMYLNVSAQVSNVTNPATVENPDPEIDVVARINAGWLFQSFGKSAYFRAKGSQGISFLRWGE